MVIYRRRHPLPDESETKQKIDHESARKKVQDKSERNHSHLLLDCFKALDFSDFIILTIFLCAAIMLIAFAVKVSNSIMEEHSSLIAAESEVTEKDVTEEEIPGYSILKEVTVDKERPDVCFQNTEGSIFTGPEYQYDIYLDEELIADDVTYSWPAYDLCTEVEEGETGTFDLTVEVFEVGEDEPLDEYDMKLTVNKKG